MRALWERIPPLARGAGIVAVIAAIVVVLSLEPVVATVGGILQIAFFLAIAFFIFLMWRERRDEISVWPRRAFAAFYGAAILAVVAIGYYILQGASGLDAVAFLVILGLCGFSMWRVWREQHTYG